MKRKAFWLLLTSFCLAVFLAGNVQTPSSNVAINKITVQPGKLNTKIVLETDAALATPKTFYALDGSKTVVVEIDGIKTDLQPQIQTAERDLVSGLKVEKAGANALRLLVELRELVPFRVISGKDQTVIELNKIQREKGDYIIEPATQELLARAGNSAVFMNKVSVEDRDGELRFTAKLSREAAAQVFSLEKPLRLVVDVFNAVYEESAAVYPVDREGLKKMRVAQFQLGDPHAITRIVFDLAEPKFYRLRSDGTNLVVSFPHQNSAVQTAAAPPVPPTPPAMSQPKPEVQAKTQESNRSAVPLQPAPAKPDNGKNGKQETAPEATLIQEPQEQRFQPRTINERETRYSGEVITLKFKDADLRDVILYLGDFAKLNVVFDPEVRGVVTCNLEDVPWDQALDILLRNNKLGKVLEGNVLRIAPVSVLTREDEEQRRLRESKELAGPLIVRTITLSYSKAKDVMALLATKKSERGEITIDERTNTLIISDVKENLDLLEKLLSVLDTPTPQVSIEARIVEATSTFIRNLGIQWGFRGIADPFYGNQTSLQFPNKVLVDGALIPQGIVTKGVGGPLGGYAINLPAPAFATAMGFSFANVLDTFRLDMAITALETAGEGRIISSPKVTTQNNQEAEIIQGRQIPVQTVANFTVTTRYVNAALELRATPQITAEGTIIMTIEIQNNAADFANLVNGIPPITTQSASTTVMVPDGGTTVIGGIYRTEDSITRERVPFLWSIPIIGSLFKNFARTKQNRELLIFITPRIIK
jgi:type IV pilus assembly protein PilQ